ncbi:hypothetical protein SmJEL517_g02840 [Synchytrium microbalum]|uniref:Ubiquitin carboxyl-terminal hydrolase n=1 Tax=Synchytrium microbalum TaxID=1806994 RepID=A0A507CAH9_9FUNG|nr:uncharacterized protein SmJEL517_g02840 [Synchytrium microbalum]TPX34515.1 hypothetical protein SmJEL517_g02840 [Synchytrium microbalum]
MVLTDFYNHDAGSWASNVHLMGSFDDWTKGVAATKKGGSFMASVDCKPGTEVTFRWVVDGQWLNSSNYPARPDGYNWNMYRTIEPETVDLPPLTGPIVASTLLASSIAPASTTSATTVSTTPVGSPLASKSTTAASQSEPTALPPLTAPIVASTNLASSIAPAAKPLATTVSTTKFGSAGSTAAPATSTATKSEPEAVVLPPLTAPIVASTNLASSITPPAKTMVTAPSTASVGSAASTAKVPTSSSSSSSLPHHQSGVEATLEKAKEVVHEISDKIHPKKKEGDKAAKKSGGGGLFKKMSTIFHKDKKTTTDASTEKKAVKGHALAHFEETGHPLVFDIEQKMSYCYKCDEFAYIGDKEQEIDVIRQKLTGEPTSDGATPAADAASSSQGKPKSKRKRATQKYHHVTGLSNLGNTCFMNVVLQSLFHTVLFRRYCIDAPPWPLSPETPIITTQPLPPTSHTSPSPTRTTRSSVASKREQSIMNEFCDLIRDMWGTQSHALSPDAFLSAIWKSVPMFRGYQQQDAQEFIRYLLDRINTDLSRKNKRTIINRVFQGTLFNEVRCLKCGQVSTKEDPFLDLSLPIPERFVERKNKVEQRADPCTLDDCLRAFTDIEELTESEKYMCPHCKTLERAEKKLSVLGLPPVLCLHLKRFKFTRHIRCKIDTYVRFPITDFNIAPYTRNGVLGDAKPVWYDLYAVIVHHGSSGSGHFLAFTWSPENSSWFQMNDGSAKATSPEDVAQQQAYMLFYSRRNHQEVLETPEEINPTSSTTTPSRINGRINSSSSSSSPKAGRYNGKDVIEIDMDPSRQPSPSNGISAMDGVSTMNGSSPISPSRELRIRTGVAAPAPSGVLGAPIPIDSDDEEQSTSTRQRRKVIRRA